MIATKKIILLVMLFSFILPNVLATTTLINPPEASEFGFGEGLTYFATSDVSVAVADTACTFAFSLNDGTTFNSVVTVVNTTAINASTAYTNVNFFPSVYSVDQFRVSCTATNSTDTVTETDTNSVSSSQQFGTQDATEAGQDIVTGTLVQIALLIGVIVLAVILALIVRRLSALGKFGK